MKRTFVLLATAALVLLAAGVRAADMAKPTVVTPSTIKWVAGTGDMKGTWSALLYGNPSKAGSEYALRIKVPTGMKIPPHTHGKLEEVTVLQGTFLVGLGTKWDDKKLTALPAGSYAAMPANVAHYGQAKGELIVELHGIGPESMTMVKGGM